MTKLNYYWKIWLRSNPLTKDVDNDYTAEVSTVNDTKRNEDIAQRIINEGSEIKFDTLLSIFNQRDRVVINMLQEGHTVLTASGRLSPRVTGSWMGASATFDPQVHKITLDMTPTDEIREALNDVGVEILGVKESAGFIGLVTDTATGMIDGSITAGDDIMIDGDRIRIAPDDDPALGIYFVSEAGVATKVTRRLTQNDRSRIIARVPALAPGKYTLRIDTKFTGGARDLKQVRSITYDRPLVVS